MTLSGGSGGAGGLGYYRGQRPSPLPPRARALKTPYGGKRGQEHIRLPLQMLATETSGPPGAPVRPRRGPDAKKGPAYPPAPRSPLEPLESLGRRRGWRGVEALKTGLHPHTHTHTSTFQSTISMCGRGPHPLHPLQGPTPTGGRAAHWGPRVNPSPPGSHCRPQQPPALRGHWSTPSPSPYHHHHPRLLPKLAKGGRWTQCPQQGHTHHYK